MSKRKSEYDSDQKKFLILANIHLPDKSISAKGIVYPVGSTTEQLVKMISYLDKLLNTKYGTGVD